MGGVSKDHFGSQGKGGSLWGAKKGSHNFLMLPNGFSKRTLTGGTVTHRQDTRKDVHIGVESTLKSVHFYDPNLWLVLYWPK